MYRRIHGGGIARAEIALVIEITDSHLRRVGASSQEVYDLLASYGYVAIGFRLIQGRWKRSLRLSADASVRQTQHDTLFVRPDSVFYEQRVMPELEAQDAPS